MSRFDRWEREARRTSRDLGGDSSRALQLKHRVAELPAAEQQQALCPARPLDLSAASPALKSLTDSLTGMFQLAPEETSSENGPTARDIAYSGFADSARRLPYKEEMEASFGSDFSNVQCYSGPAARAANDALGARAYTLGNRIGFREASPDRALVAHELTHVLQQTGDQPSFSGGAGDVDTSGERQARTVEAAVAGGKPARAALSRVVQRRGEAPARSAADFFQSTAIAGSLLGFYKFKVTPDKIQLGQKLSADGFEAKFPLSPNWPVFLTLKGSCALVLPAVTLTKTDPLKKLAAQVVPKIEAGLVYGFDWLNAYVKGAIKFAGSAQVEIEKLSIKKIEIPTLEISLAGTLGMSSKALFDVKWQFADPKLFKLHLFKYEDGKYSLAGADVSDELKSFARWLDRALTLRNTIEKYTPEFIKEYRLYLADRVYELLNGSENREDIEKHEGELDKVYERVNWLDKHVKDFKRHPQLGKLMESASGRLKLAQKNIAEWLVVRTELESMLEPELETPPKDSE